MKCPINECKAKLVELKSTSKDYGRGYNYKCIVCQKFYTIVSEDF